MIEAKPMLDRHETALSLMSFGAIKRSCAVTWPMTSSSLSLPVDLFRDLLRCALEIVKFDEDYYLHLYPDVGDALANGLFQNARHHYVEFGYFEDRLPFRVEVDEAFYFWAYPDVKMEVRQQSFPSAQVQFELCGHKEGRLPLEGWTLMAG
jgi:hypothetical protein